LKSNKRAIRIPKEVTKKCLDAANQIVPVLEGFSELNPVLKVSSFHANTRVVGVIEPVS
jgi:hypothetical protein